MNWTACFAAVLVICGLAWNEEVQKGAGNALGECKMRAVDKGFHGAFTDKGYVQMCMEAHGYPIIQWKDGSAMCLWGDNWNVNCYADTLAQTVIKWRDLAKFALISAGGQDLDKTGVK